MFDRTRRFCISLVSAALLATGTAAAELDKPAGPALVTITGKITHANQEGFEAFRDKLFGVHDLRFDRAAAFDLAMLEELGMQQVSLQYRDWDARHTFDGPLLRDVLAAAGASGDTVLPMALDGYAAEIAMSDLQKWPVILALKMDGEYMAVGGAGPAFVIYPMNDYPELAGEDDAKLVWGVFHIAVE